VVVEARDAHPELPGEILDPQRLVEVPSELGDGSGDAVRLAAQGRDVPDPAALLARQEPVDDFPLDEWCEDAYAGRASRSRTSRTTASSRSASSGLTSMAATAESPRGSG